MHTPPPASIKTKSSKSSGAKINANNQQKDKEQRK